MKTLLIALLLSVSCYAQHIKTSQADIGNINGAIVNGVYNVALCATSPAPTWCSGGDLGAWVNSAVAAAPSGSQIYIPASASCTSYTTPIVFGPGKYDTLAGEPGGGSCIKFTPSSGTAVTFDPGVSEHQAYGIRDLQLIGPGSGTTATGVLLGSSNGAEGIVISGFRTGTNCCSSDGFGTGITQGNTGAFLVTIRDSQIQGNGTGLSTTTFLENLRLIGNGFTHNSTNAIILNATGWTDVYSLGNSYDDNGPISLPATGGVGNNFTSAGDHFENSSVGSAAQPYITIANNSHVTISGSVMLDDRASSTNTGMINCSGASLVYIYGMARGTGGITVNPFLNASGTCRAWMQFSQSTGTFTDYSSAYTGSIFDSGFPFSGKPSLTLLNGTQGASTVIPFGSNVTTGLTGNMSSTQLGGATPTAGMYEVCLAMFATATGSATAVHGTVSSRVNGNNYTINVGTVLSTSALTNIGSGCTAIPVDGGVTINVATSGYSGSGTYTVRSEVNEIQ